MTEKQVDALSPVVLGMSEHWPMIDALVGGTSAMRAAGQQFLPKWPREEDDSYKCRIETATLFDAFGYTCRVMAAKPFARPITFDKDPSPRIKDMLENVDLKGTELHAFAHHLFLHNLQYGVSGVLVDYPKVPQTRTIAEEKKVGARPYFSMYAASCILGWRTVMTPNGVELSQLRLLEFVTEPDGEWGEKTVKQVRVLTPGNYEIFRKIAANDGTAKWASVESGRMSVSGIPFVFFYGLKDEKIGVGYTPLLELAHANVKHWQSSSDQDTITHIARVPILFAKGVSDGDNIVIGANSMVRARDASADLKFVEHSGAAIEAGRASLLELENQMRQMGAELLVQRARLTTATQVRSEDEGNRSILQTIVENFEESLEIAFKWVGEWMKEPFDSEIRLYKDFGSDDLSEKTGDLLLGAVDRNIVSRETAFKQLQRMDVVSPDIVWEEEEDRLELQAGEEDDQSKTSENDTGKSGVTAGEDESAEEEPADK